MFKLTSCKLSSTTELHCENIRNIVFAQSVIRLCDSYQFQNKFQFKKINYSLDIYIYIHEIYNLNLMRYILKWLLAFFLIR